MSGINVHKHSLPPFSTFIESLPDSNNQGSGNHLSQHPSQHLSQQSHVQQSPSFGDSTGGPRLDPLDQSGYYASRNNSGYGNYVPRYHKSYDSRGSYPANYQFPVPAPVPAATAFPPPVAHSGILRGSGSFSEPSAKRQKLHGSLAPEMEWRPDQTINDMSRLISTCGDIVNGLDSIRSIYNKSLYENTFSAQDNPNQASTIHVKDNRFMSIDSFKTLLMSIPTSVLNNLEFYLQQNHKLVSNVRKAHLFCLAEREYKQEYSNQVLSPPVYSHKRSHATSTSFPYSHTRIHSDSGVPPNHLRQQIQQEPSKHPNPQQKRKSQPQKPPKPVRSTPSPDSKPANSKNNTSKTNEHKANEHKTNEHKNGFIKFDSLKSKPSSPTECAHCGSIKTPEWRRGPGGDKTLCNACGIFFSKLIKKLQSPAEAARVMTERKQKGDKLDRHV